MLVSYAQNFEDVMLWRALSSIKQGFYLDVGANDPITDSVTKLFYDRGWCGINIEPVEAFFERLQQERPRDINLRLVAASAGGHATFYDVANTGLSTTEAHVAEQHSSLGRQVTERQVEAATLATICAAHVSGEVHFLKIDVEGGTRAVLEGADFTTVRPWIVVVEATEPDTQREAFADWEDLVLSAGYRFAYADGLNRFYLAAEHCDLQTFFRYPPNVFDQFVRAADGDTVARVERDLFAHSFAEQARRTAAAEERAHRAQQDRQQLRQAFDDQVARTRAGEERAYRLMREAQAETARADAGERRIELEIHRHSQISARLREREDVLSDIFRSRSWRLTTRLGGLGAIMRGHRGAAAGMPTPRRPPRPTIYIECTHTYHSDLNTGIQRVVRNILRNAPSVARQYGYEVVPVIAQADQFRFADAGQVLADKQNARPASAGPATPEAPPVAQPGIRRRFARVHLVAQDLRRLVASRLPPRAVQRLSAAWPGRVALARGLRALVRRPQVQPPSPATAAQSLDDFERCDGSILLLLDSSWTTPIWPATGRFKQSGGTVMGIVYDLIPISHSHTSVHELTLAFKAWLAEHFCWTDGFICISRSTAETLVEYIMSTRGAAQLARAPVRHFHLGSELDFIDPRDVVRPLVDAFFQPERHVFLMVGSIEPRKMHAHVLDAFDGLWACGGTASLVIVGHNGWKTEAFLERVAQHPQHGHQLFISRDATDAELDHCYRNASALVIASEIEGFGLPVVEAFQRGLAVICSDIPVFREIADGKATFFALGDPAHLTAALQEFCRTVAIGDRRQRRPQSWISWRQSTEQLLAAVMDLSRRLEA